MSYQYVKLGTNCEPQTMCALTSNAKYILPLSSVYYKRWTPMMRYPGHDSMYGGDPGHLFGMNGDPEQIKAYDSKDSMPVAHAHKDHTASDHSQVIRGCSGCKIRN